MEESKLTDQKALPAGGPVFSSLLEVLKHLERAGFRISKSKLYRDRDKGMIRVNPDGSVPETEVRAYASTLERLEGNIDDMSDIHSRKAERELRDLELKIEKREFELAKDQGRYIPKKDFEAEMAARTATLEAGFRHLFNSKVREWVVLVNGDVKKRKTVQTICQETQAEGPGLPGSAAGRRGMV